MKTKILRILRNSEEYISGQQLCDSLGVSRTAVWKVVKQLKEEGYEIEAIQNKGYKITSFPDLVTESELLSAMHTTWAGREVCFMDQVDSTSNHARRLAGEGAPHGTLVVTEEQTAGKGRRGRGWNMQPGTAVAMSLLLRPDIEPVNASMLTLVMGLSVTQACRKLYGTEVGIKWPNDIIINKKKICGILTEMNAQVDYVEHVVIGVGINTSVKEMPDEIKEKATSLSLETGKEINRSQLIDEVLQAFERNYGQFAETEDLSGLIDDYNTCLIHKDVEVKVIEPKREFSGISRGINEKGELLIEKEDGSMQAVYAGEVSVRGIYGYV